MNLHIQDLSVHIEIVLIKAFREVTRCKISKEHSVTGCNLYGKEHSVTQNKFNKNHSIKLQH